MVLDEPQKNDVTFTDQGITFAVDKYLFNKAKPIRLDFAESAGRSDFQFTSRLPSRGGCC
jgi:iron-sulfur cluster assembly protein